MSEPNPGLLVVTHGRLAEEIVSAVRTIIGDSDGIEAFSLDWDDDPADAQRRIEEAVKRLDRGGGVLVLTDMFGGTPTNLALSLLETSRVEVVTGVNLPMLLKLSTCRTAEARLPEVARLICAYGQKNVTLASDLLRPKAAGGAATGSA